MSPRSSVPEFYLLLPPTQQPISSMTSFRSWRETCFPNIHNNFFPWVRDFSHWDRGFSPSVWGFLPWVSNGFLEAEAFLLASVVFPLEERRKLLLELEEDIFIAWGETCFPFMRMNLSEETLIAIILFDSLFFFASIFGSADNIFSEVFRLLENFFEWGRRKTS